MYRTTLTKSHICSYYLNRLDLTAAIVRDQLRKHENKFGESDEARKWIYTYKMSKKSSDG